MANPFLGRRMLRRKAALGILRSKDPLSITNTTFSEDPLAALTRTRTVPSAAFRAAAPVESAAVESAAVPVAEEAGAVAAKAAGFAKFGLGGWLGLAALGLPVAMEWMRQRTPSDEMDTLQALAGAATVGSQDEIQMLDAQINERALGKLLADFGQADAKQEVSNALRSARDRVGLASAIAANMPQIQAIAQTVAPTADEIAARLGIGPLT